MPNVAIVGLGNIGQTHFEAYEAVEHAEVTHVCSRREDSLAAYPHVTVVTDYDALLAIETIDIIDICLPTYLHESYIEKAAAAGKQIICEKPLALTPLAAERIAAVCDHYHVALFVGHVLRFWPAYQAIKQVAATASFQKVHTAHVQRLGPSPGWGAWFGDPEKGGGALLDLHIHDVDYLTYVFGKVARVYAVGEKNQQGAWDHVLTTLVFTNGLKVFVEASHLMPETYPFTARFRLQAEQSLLTFRLLTDAQFAQTEPVNELLVYQDGAAPERQEIDEADPFVNELSYFVDCVAHQMNNEVVPVTDVLYTMQVMAHIKTSLETGQVVTLSDD